MSLSHHIEEVRAGIKAGRYGNEAAVSQGIVLRLLQALGWPTYDTQVVCPEFSLGGRRVDYALCHPANKALAFIEVKQIGQSDGAERQLFEYAFHTGVQLAILTDGQEWNFFLPAEQGDYAERRVYKLDMVERDAAESVVRLERYLAYAQVASGSAIAAAREDYRNVSRSRQMLSTLPEAWSRLVAEEDDLLLELLADKVESLCGFKPDVDSVARFLRDHIAIQGGGGAASTGATQKAGSLTRTASTPIQAPRSSAAPTQKLASVGIGFSLDGQFVPCRNGKDVLVNIFEALAHRDETFLERFAARPKHGRTRRYLARSAEDLYPGRPDLAGEHFSRLKSGWYVGTNVSRAQIERIVEMACEVSRVRFGKDLIVNIVE
jgi:predicted type IV restriction endonuclease